MRKTKQGKDHSNITVQEALDWTDKNCRLNDVRKRLMSRSVAYTLGTQLLIAYDVIDDLQKHIKILERGIDS